MSRARKVALEEQHRRIRALAGETGGFRVHHHAPPDLLRLFLLFPAIGGHP